MARLAVAEGVTKFAEWRVACYGCDAALIGSWRASGPGTSLTTNGAGPPPSIGERGLRRQRQPEYADRTVCDDRRDRLPDVLRPGCRPAAGSPDQVTRCWRQNEHRRSNSCFGPRSVPSSSYWRTTTDSAVVDADPPRARPHAPASRFLFEDGLGAVGLSIPTSRRAAVRRPATGSFASVDDKEADRALRGGESDEIVPHADVARGTAARRSGVRGDPCEVRSAANKPGSSHSHATTERSSSCSRSARHGTSGPSSCSAVSDVDSRATSRTAPDLAAGDSCGGVVADEGTRPVHRSALIDEPGP